MLLSRAINDFEKYLRDTERRSPRTYEGYGRDLRRYLAKQCEDDDTRAFTRAAVDRVLGVMTERGMGTASVLRMIAALKKFSTWGLAQTPPLWKTDPTLTIVKIPQPRRRPKPFTREELDKLMALELPRQERAIRALLRWTGMRASALCALRVEDVNMEPTSFLSDDGTTTHTAGTIRSTGKGGHETAHYMTASLKDALWEQYLQAQVEGRHTLLWRPHTRRSRKRDPAARHESFEPLNANALHWLCRAWGAKAGVQKVHPHRFRHSLASQLIRAGTNPALVRDLLGHQSIATTMGYAQTDNAQAAAAMMALESFGAAQDRAVEIAALRARLRELEGGGS